MKALKSSSEEESFFGGGGGNNTHNKALFGFKSRRPGFGFKRAPIGPTVPFSFKDLWTLGCCLPGQE